MRLRSVVVTLSATVLAGGLARADEFSDKLGNYEVEARALATDLPRPNENTTGSGRRLVDAQVALSMGDFDDAGLSLLDLVGTTQGPDAEVATYYLAEALYGKGDRGSATSYYTTLAKNPMSKYYQLALERLVEIAIDTRELDSVAEWKRALEGLAPSQPAAAYVLGKLAFASANYDDALMRFAAVPAGNEHKLQALYFTATSLLAKKDLAKATDAFADLIGRRPQSAIDRRVIELGQLALGRLFYQQDLPSKSIDAYLQIDRHSDLFPDALYEVGWVYVKSKQYDKALRALELLEKADPNSTRQPTVQILEGNLRIRKAQALRNLQIENPNPQATPSVKDDESPTTIEDEYQRATKVFAATHDQFMPAYLALSQMVDGSLDPLNFVAQLAGSSAGAFEVTPAIPESAAQWLRDEPGVQRFVGIESDLIDIRRNLTETEATIARLEGVLAASDRTRVYPQLAARRARIAVIVDDVNALRSKIADRQLSFIDSSGELAQLSASRKTLAQQFAALGNPERAYGDRVAETQKAYDAAIDDLAAIDGAVDSAQASAVAIRKSVIDGGDAIPADKKASTTTQLNDLGKEAQAITGEVVALRREAQLGRSLSGFGDPDIAHARELRKQLSAALAAEQRLLSAAAGGSRNASDSRTLAAEADRAAKLIDQLDSLDAQIDAMVAKGLEQVTAQLIVEHKNLDAFKQELAEYDADTRAAAGTALVDSFKVVKAKFDDVVVRTDLGVVDVSWSRKEDSDDDLKRLNLARSRELKQLKDEFKDILDAGTQAPAKKPQSLLPPPTAEGASPDAANGKAPERVAPSGGGSSPSAPTVKPTDGKQPAPKGTPAPKQGKGGTP